MIRILQCVNNMHRAGLETLLMNYYRNIDRTKIQFDFLMHRQERSEYDDEIENLEAKYGLPQGRLYVAYFENKVAGCIALRPLNDMQCEMKRLYVKPEFRGNGIAKILAERIISDAKSIGYSSMLLDTLPFLQTAISMYRKMGFYEIECYNDSPLDDTIYMKLDL